MPEESFPMIAKYSELYQSHLLTHPSSFWTRLLPQGLQLQLCRSLDRLVCTDNLLQRLSTHISSTRESKHLGPAVFLLPLHVPRDSTSVSQDSMGWALCLCLSSFLSETLCPFHVLSLRTSPSMPRESLRSLVKCSVTCYLHLYLNKLL